MLLKKKRKERNEERRLESYNLCVHMYIKILKKIIDVCATWQNEKVQTQYYYASTTY